MNRRRMLQWLSGVIAAGCAAIVAIPGAAYVWATVRRRETSATIVRRVAPLEVLRVGQPVVLALSGSRQDAWTLYPEELIGRVWLVRRSDPSISPAQAEVAAFTTVCPHLGCEVQEDAGRKGFYCPCHKARFDLAGTPVNPLDRGEHNPAPRGLDSLQCRVVQDELSGEWWVEVKYEKFEHGLTKKIARA
jgi:menaquinol-cytochrome c reductase iron-sulfur subunit